MKPMTPAVRKNIQKYIKNGLDISELIQGYTLANEDLSGAKIRKFNRSNDNLRGLNISRCVIGAPGVINNGSGSDWRGSKWCDTVVDGIFYLRRCDARDADFSGMVAINAEYQYTDFRGAKFCETCMRIGSEYGFKAKFDESLFKDWSRGWNLEITVKED